MSVDPSGCARYIIDIHGAAGVAWLEHLPALLTDCAQRWALTIESPFADLSYNYVAPALRADGMPVVLKACVPNPELRQEAEALRCFGGAGIVRLLDADLAQGVLLLERLIPGTPLTALENDEEVTRISVQVMRALWRPAPLEHSFATVAGWARGLERLRAHFNGGFGPFPPALVDRAAGLFADLLAAEAEQWLIHGDMHPQNILTSTRAPWLAIDPKGVVGDPLFDVATFLNNLPAARPLPDLKCMLERRTSQVSEMLGVDRARLHAWGLAHAVLSGWWSFEDHGRGWEWAFAIAGLH